MLWELKRTLSMRQFFWATKHMLKIMIKKIFTILRWFDDVYLSEIDLIITIALKAVLHVINRHVLTSKTHLLIRQFTFC